MRVRLKNFFTSGWDIEDDIKDVKSRYQMLNIALILSFFGLIFGIFSNIISSKIGIVYVEVSFLVLNIVMFFLLRIDKKFFDPVSNILTLQFASLFLYLMYICEPSAMKHVWLFTYPIIILYFQDMKKAILWLCFLILMIFIAPLQPFIDIGYTFHQTTYILIVLFIVSFIMYFYKVKIDEAKKTIFEQQNKLQNFNLELEVKVKQKTVELEELNESLEVKVKNKIKELIAKDELLNIQSKQAVMGEMISMIAHQWRQPLSNITLQISNLHIKRLLGEEVSVQESDKMLSEISDTIVYLSDTIDDFKTYFRPNKEKDSVEIHELLQRAINFTMPRAKDIDVKIINDKQSDIVANIYINELIQVILNLINNALDAIVEFEIKNAKIFVYAKENEDSISLFVEDNANGISKENLPRIFEPYFSTKGKNGTGLGLYMSQMLIRKQFQGEIRVESSTNGTIFEVEILKEIL
ncbi:MAG: GHKL domain-containing protein [Sulfurimonas sp.]|nr:GHKL domain-containing protein [Sulfurimonas sp.]